MITIEYKENNNMNCIVCCNNFYKYKDWTFEKMRYGCPWPLKKDFTPRKRAGIKFYEMLDEFFHLPKEEQEKYILGEGEDE